MFYLELLFDCADFLGGKQSEEALDKRDDSCEESCLDIYRERSDESCASGVDSDFAACINDLCGVVHGALDLAEVHSEDA